jgi:hypothetical protein
MTAIVRGIVSLSPGRWSRSTSGKHQIAEDNGQGEQQNDHPQSVENATALRHSPSTVKVTCQAIERIFQLSVI